MTIQTTELTKEFQCDGLQTDFVVDYPVLEKDDLIVILIDTTDDSETPLVIGTDYFVTLETNYENGCTVTTINTYPSEYKLKVTRNTDVLQKTDYIEGSDFPADQTERALDKLTMIAQETDESITHFQGDIELNNAHRLGDGTDHAQVAQNAIDISGKLDSVVAGTNITIDNTDPNNPVINSTGGGGDGDMLKSVYDTDNNGIVDNSEKLAGNPPADLPISDATQTALNAKANSNNVLELDNTTAFTPDNDYEPAPKKYVDDACENAKYGQVDFFIGGNYNASDSSSLLEDMMNTYFAWGMADATIIAVRFVHKKHDSDTGSAQPKIHLYLNGTSIASQNMAGDGTWVGVSPLSVAVTDRDDFEIGVTGGGNRDAENLTVSVKYKIN